MEQDGALVEQLKALQAQLKAEAVRVQRGDGISALRQAAPGSLDVVFIDPPFDAGLFDSALQAGVAALAPEGWIYLEAPTAYTDEQLAPLGLVLHRHLKAGMVHAHLLRRTAA